MPGENRARLNAALDRALPRPQPADPLAAMAPRQRFGPRPAWEQFESGPIPAPDQDALDMRETLDDWGRSQLAREAEQRQLGPFGPAASIGEALADPAVIDRITSGDILGEAARTVGLGGPDDGRNTLGEIGDAFGDAYRGSVRALGQPGLNQQIGGVASSLAEGAGRTADAAGDWWNDEGNDLSRPYRMGGARSLFSVDPNDPNGPLRGYLPSLAEATAGGPLDLTNDALSGMDWERARMRSRVDNGDGDVAFDASRLDRYADQAGVNALMALANIGFAGADVLSALAPRPLNAARAVEAAPIDVEAFPVAQTPDALRAVPQTEDALAGLSARPANTMRMPYDPAIPGGVGGELEALVNPSEQQIADLLSQQRGTFRSVGLARLENGDVIAFPGTDVSHEMLASAGADMAATGRVSAIGDGFDNTSSIATELAAVRGRGPQRYFPQDFANEMGIDPSTAERLLARDDRLAFPNFGERRQVRIGEQVNRDGTVTPASPIDWEAGGDQFVRDWARKNDLLSTVGPAALAMGAGAALYPNNAEASDGAQSGAGDWVLPTLGAAGAGGAAYLAARGGRAARLAERAGRAANDDILARIGAASTDFMDEAPVTGRDAQGQPIRSRSDIFPNQMWDRNNPSGVSRGGWRESDLTNRANTDISPDVQDYLDSLPPLERAQVLVESNASELLSPYERALLEQGSASDRARTRWGMEGDPLAGVALGAGAGLGAGLALDGGQAEASDGASADGAPIIPILGGVGGAGLAYLARGGRGMTRFLEDSVGAGPRARGFAPSSSAERAARNQRIIELANELGTVNNHVGDPGIGGAGRKLDNSSEALAARLREEGYGEVTRSTIAGVLHRERQRLARQAEAPAEVARARSSDEEAAQRLGMSVEKYRRLSARSSNAEGDPLASVALPIAAGAGGAYLLSADDANAESLQDGREIVPIQGDLRGQTWAEPNWVSTRLADGSEALQRTLIGEDGRPIVVVARQSPDLSIQVIGRVVGAESSTSSPDVLANMSAERFPSTVPTDAFGDPQSVYERPVDGQAETPAELRMLAAGGAGLLARTAAGRMRLNQGLRSIAGAGAGYVADQVLTQGEADPLESLALGAGASATGAVIEGAAPMAGRLLTQEAGDMGQLALERDPLFVTRRDAFADTLSTEAPRVRSVEVTADPLDHYVYGQDPLGNLIPQGEAAAQGFSTERASGNVAGPREQFLSATPAQQLAWMDQVAPARTPDRGRIGVTRADGLPPPSARPETQERPALTSDPLSNIAASEAPPKNAVPEGVRTGSVRPVADGNEVTAQIASADEVVRTNWGADLQARAGKDYILTGPDSERWVVRRDIFDRTYEPTEGGRFRKSPNQVVSYWISPDRRTINTLEGPVEANPGDYVMIGSVGEMWPVRPEQFQRKYTSGAAPQTPDGVAPMPRQFRATPEDIMANPDRGTLAQGSRFANALATIASEFDVEVARGARGGINAKRTAANLARAARDNAALQAELRRRGLWSALLAAGATASQTNQSDPLEGVSR